MTPDQIKLLQKSGIDWLGNPLKADGLSGPKTNWWQGITSLSQVRQDTLKIALGYHAAGMKEENGPGIENGGTFVDMLLKPSGKKHLPWCAALVSHVYQKAGLTLPKYFLSAWSIIDWAKKNNCIVTEPLPADVEAFLYPIQPGDKDRKGHVRLVLGINGTTTAGVDGNVTNAVRVGLRHDRSERYFIRLPGLGDQHGVLTMPDKLMFLDKLGDR